MQVKSLIALLLITSLVSGIGPLVGSASAEEHHPVVTADSASLCVTLLDLNRRRQDIARRALSDPDPVRMYRTKIARGAAALGGNCIAGLRTARRTDRYSQTPIQLMSDGGGYTDPSRMTDAAVRDVIRNLFEFVIDFVQQKMPTHFSAPADNQANAGGGDRGGSQGGSAGDREGGGG